MKQETMKQDRSELIQAILRRVVSTPIPVHWRSNETMPSGGERRSFARGASGQDIQARVEYEPGDDPREIDWAATAQTGGQTMFITQYIEPRDLKVFILADVNPTMCFGTHRTSKLVLAAELAGSVIKSASKTHDRVKFVAYSAQDVVASLRLMSAQTAMFPAIASLIESSGGAVPGNVDDTDSGGLMKALACLPRQRALVFIISDFLNPNDAERDALKRAALCHDIVCLLVSDRRELELPEGWGLYTFSDLRTGRRRSFWLTEKRRAQFARAAHKRQQELFAFFQDAHCDCAAFNTAEGEEALTRVMRLFGGHRK